MDKLYYLGLDVGTGSARAGIFSATGVLLASSVKAIKMFRPAPDFAEHSSSDIWQAICSVTRQTLEQGGVGPEQIGGIGIDATCSLVAIKTDGAPVSLSPSGEAAQNVIVWLDHRAVSQAETINKTKHALLRFTGDSISPEMQLPKLLWLKENLPEQFSETDYFFDLPDWLVHRATGSFTRSLCSATCKWTYQGNAGTAGEGWDAEFLTSIGLGALKAEKFEKIGNHFAEPSEPVGEGLSEKAAAELGLIAGTPVGASMIDAYAGALGTFNVSGGELVSLQRMALISGTSACHISMTNEAAFVPGVWGPYFSVLKPGFWANEAGQSSAGALIDRVIDGHSAASGLRTKAAAAGKSIFEMLDDLLVDMAGSMGATHFLGTELHVQPDFHGNRAPLADPFRRGAIVGLTMDVGERDLARQYLAVLQALAYGTRQILDTLKQKGVTIDTLVVSGGLARNLLYLREHADATGCNILVPEQDEPVLLGSAMLGAVAGGGFETLEIAMNKMSGAGKLIRPREQAVGEFHDAKFAVFERMQADFVHYRDVMTPFEEN